jgi:alpha-L-fucosidase
MVKDAFRVGGVLTLLMVCLASAATAPAPFGPLPTERQLRWHEMEYYGFLHFTVNTFTDKEWGFGDEKPAIFNPSQMDIRQWARVARDAGMKGLIITAKHHDGFCLWPSAYTEHSVKHSPWKNGKGDIVGELAAACREYGLRMGVYLSPWDRNSAVYGTPEYRTYYRSQLRELLTTYGDVFSVWYDGANGGDGYYGGANETRRIDNKTYYRWPEVHKIVRELQPMAVMFSDAGPDIRWVGNERGFGNETNYATLKRDELYPGTPRSRELPQGHRDGNYWVPAEADVSIRPGWFYHASQDERVKSLDQMLEIYYRSVGMGCNLLLNIPPDRRGLIHENDIASLMALRKVLDLTFDEDLAQGKPAKATNVRGEDATFGAAKLTDGDRDTYWTTDDNVTEAEATVDLGEPVLFNRVRVQEYIALGQRVEGFAIDARIDGAWKTIAEGTTIGPRRILQFEGVVADRVRLRLTSSRACPTISTLELYLAPARVTIGPEVSVFMGSQKVTLASDTPGARIYYTLDNSAPTPQSQRYTSPFELTKSATVKASAWVGKTPGYPLAERDYEYSEAADLLPAVKTPSNLGAGLRYSYYEGGWQTLDQMADRQPTGKGVTSAFNIALRKRDDHFALKFEGLIDVPADGLYEFFTESDDGSALYVDGQQVVDNDALQGMTERSGQIALQKGLHQFEVQYFNATGGMGLAVRWSGPGVAKAAIPGAVLKHKP